MSWQPARIGGIGASHGAVAEGRPANLCVIDEHAEWTVDANRQASKSKNNPYHGKTLRGRVRHTVHCGEAVVVDGEAQR
jgi:dihydroorotase